MTARLVLAGMLLVAASSARAQPTAIHRTIDAGPLGGEANVTVHASCPRCDWGAERREGVSFRISVDGRYSQHLMLWRGSAPADYQIRLGPLAPGPHRVDFERDNDLSAADAGVADVAITRVDTLTPGESWEYTARARAPILHARPNTVGRFTDLPLVMWYETAVTPRGREFRYSVIFTNEDGGTPADRLMATWGRTTDIEFVYGVEVDADGRVLAESFQGPGHEFPPFRGRHEAGHPLLWVSTDNNMVSESGPTAIRYSLVPERFDLTNMSREAVMDAHPWLYPVMAQELRREGKIVAGAPPGQGTIPDPRRFVYVEACGTVGSAALALAIGVGGPAAATSAATLDWVASDRGLAQYRVVRDGCFRIATPLPDGATAGDVRAVRVLAFRRAAAAGDAPTGDPPSIEVTRINRVFMLDDAYLPGPSMLDWVGTQRIRAGGPPFEVSRR